MHQEFLSIKQVCSKVGISSATLYRRIKSGELTAVKCGQRTFIHNDEVQNWIQSFPEIVSQCENNRL